MRVTLFILAMALIEVLVFSKLKFFGVTPLVTWLAVIAAAPSSRFLDLMIASGLAGFVFLSFGYYEFGAVVGLVLLTYLYKVWVSSIDVENETNALSFAQTSAIFGGTLIIEALNHLHVLGYFSGPNWLHYFGLAMAATYSFWIIGRSVEGRWI